jgi:hypothetical protein
VLRLCLDTFGEGNEFDTLLIEGPDTLLVPFELHGGFESKVQQAA